MIVAKKKRESNIAEYLLYMWQVEDIIRAFNFDITLINNNIIEQYNVSADEKTEIKRWYEELIDMMRIEGKCQSGHLQINENIIIKLYDIHLQLMAEKKEALYIAAYYKALPYIAEVKTKQGNNNPNDVEVAFNLLYGVLMLKLSKRKVSEETLQATKAISAYLSQLADFYKREKKGELEF